MAWAGLDDRMPRNRKYSARTALGKLTFVHSILYCALELTDGLITAAEQLSVFAEAGSECVIARGDIKEELITARLWDDTGDGTGDIRVHDYLDWNPSREQVLARRAATKARVTAFRSKAHDEGNEDCNGVTNAVTNGVTNSVTCSDVTALPTLLVTPASPIPYPLSGIPESGDQNAKENTKESARGVRKRTSPSLPKPTVATWEAYRLAYMAAYHDRTGASIEPVRNATVNGQLGRLVERLGAEEAPLVAAWYVGHRNAYYVQQGHSIGALLHDAEKLRTEWKAGVRLHARDVREIDRLSADGQMWADLAAERAAQKEVGG